MGRRTDLDVVAVEKPCPYRESNLCRLAQLVTKLTYLSRIHPLIHIKLVIVCYQVNILRDLKDLFISDL